MRRIERAGTFKRDFRREMRGRHRGTLDRDLTAVIAALADDQPLASRHRDHALIGEWRDFRDCHVRPDLLLIDRRSDVETLQPVRLGSHSELGL